MTALACPHCGVYAVFDRRWIERTEDWPPDADYACGLYTCNGCGKPIAAIHDGLGISITDYWPKRASGKDYPDVPDDLASVANDAHLCLDAGSGRGAATLARAVVEAVAKTHGILNGNLESKIDALHSAGHISEAMKETPASVGHCQALDDGLGYRRGIGAV